MRMPTAADVQARLRNKRLMEMLGRQGEMNNQMADQTLNENRAALQGARPKSFDVQSKVYDDIAKYARSKQAGELKQRYLPDEEDPGLAPDDALREGGDPAEPDADDLDEESMNRLAAMAEE